MRRNDDDNKDKDEEPPDFPPRLRYFGSDTLGLKKGEVAPESVRRIFGTNDFLKYDRPKPPPPPPPNTYHKKPMYWQLQGTGYAQPVNRIALWFLVGFTAFGAFLVKFGRFPDRIDRWFDLEDENSPEWYAQHQRHVEFNQKMIFGLADDEIHINRDMDTVRNIPKEYVEHTRWDIREVDRRVKGIPHMHQLRGSDMKNIPSPGAGGTGAPTM